MSSICSDCGHKHRGIPECTLCDCVWVAEIITMAPDFIDTIKSWFKK